MWTDGQSADDDVQALAQAEAGRAKLEASGQSPRLSRVRGARGDDVKEGRARSRSSGGGGGARETAGLGRGSETVRDTRITERECGGGSICCQRRYRGSSLSPDVRPPPRRQPCPECFPYLSPPSLHLPLFPSPPSASVCSPLPSSHACRLCTPPPVPPSVPQAVLVSYHLPPLSVLASLFQLFRCLLILNRLLACPILRYFTLDDTVLECLAARDPLPFILPPVLRLELALRRSKAPTAAHAPQHPPPRAARVAAAAAPPTPASPPQPVQPGLPRRTSPDAAHYRRSAPAAPALPFPRARTRLPSTGRRLHRVHHATTIHPRAARQQHAPRHLRVSVRVRICRGASSPAHVDGAPTAHSSPRDPRRANADKEPRVPTLADRG